MSQSSKKVVLLLVEGDSEETLLFKRLQRLFLQHDIRFRVEYGDMLYKDSNQRKSSKSIIGERVKDFLKTYKLKERDLLCVLHLVDIDGIFLSNNRIIVNPEISQQTVYERERILVKSEKQRERIQARNKKRSLRMRELCRTSTILPTKIHYQMYFFSGHLEHVLFDELNPQQDEKIRMIEDFMDELDRPIEQYLLLFMDLLDLEEKEYREVYDLTWCKIIENESEIARFTNVPLLFTFIDLELKKSSS
ncbi:hypothetical protein ACP2W0_12875 [Pseudobacillus badius]|uniref:hypothetical protein n=1 Tax=Bacillus badius TaxID=1455 RepID=UPI003CF6051C